MSRADSAGRGRRSSWLARRRDSTAGDSPPVVGRDCVPVGAALRAGFGLAEELYRYAGAQTPSAPDMTGYAVSADVLRTIEDRLV
jgi:hypothetical protein